MLLWGRRGCSWLLWYYDATGSLEEGKRVSCGRLCWPCRRSCFRFLYFALVDAVWMYEFALQAVVSLVIVSAKYF